MLQKLHSIIAKKDINLVVKFVGTKNNPADEPSRTQFQEFESTRFKQQYDSNEVFGNAKINMNRKELINFHFQ